MATKLKNEGEQILRVLCGSRAYGLESEESDFDYHGVFVVPTERLLALGPKIAETSWIEGHDQDNTAWEIRHFLELATHCNPTVLETFVAPIDLATGEGQRLREELFPAVLARRRVYEAFRGYAGNQRKKMFEPNGGTQATDRMIKAAIAYLRSLHHGIELLRRGTYETRIEPGRFRDLLMWIRTSVRVNQAEVVGEAMLLEDALTKAYVASTIQEEPDMAVINAFLLDIRRKHWA